MLKVLTLLTILVMSLPAHAKTYKTWNVYDKLFMQVDGIQGNFSATYVNEDNELYFSSLAPIQNCAKLKNTIISVSFNNVKADMLVSCNSDKHIILTFETSSGSIIVKFITDEYVNMKVDNDILETFNSSNFVKSRDKMRSWW